MISVFLPFRMGSERILNKNFKPLPRFKFGLFEIKIKQLIEIPEVDEIILSTDYENIIQVLDQLKIVSKKINIVERPKFLCKSDTSLLDLIKYSSKISKHNEILWTHVTSPYFDANEYSRAIKHYRDNLPFHDSLLGVTKMRDFIWQKSKSKLLNVEGNNWPRTQDLDDLFIINNAIFIYSKKICSKFENRIGKNPLLFESNKLKSLDIDDEFDFNVLTSLLNH